MENAGFSYNRHCIFQTVNFSVQPGELFCLIGPNGCGKTTLLDCLLGLRELNTGRINYDDSNISSLKPSELARRVAYVPQDHEKTFPYTVLDIVVMGRTAYTGWFAAPAAADVKVAEAALAQVRISHLKTRPYTWLSGGETQLVMIARALAQQTPVIVMDEPTAHLDFNHELIVLETLVRLIKGRRLAVIMATHVPNHAFYFVNQEVTTRVALMNDGSFTVGPAAEVLTEANLRKVYRVETRIVSWPAGDGIRLKQIIPLHTINE